MPVPIHIDVLREHARGEHTVARIDCRACEKFPPGWKMVAPPKPDDSWQSVNPPRSTPPEPKEDFTPPSTNGDWR